MTPPTLAWAYNSLPGQHSIDPDIILYLLLLAPLHVLFLALFVYFIFFLV